MAWRLHQQLTRGEFDFTVRGRISGMLWLAGIDQPVCVELEGTPARDLAGHKLVVVNPQPMGKVPDGLSRIHRGVPGEMTASRKVRLLDEDIAGASGDQNGGKLFAWHWGNAVYLEWFSESSGRMVIESACYDVTIEHVGSWQQDPEFCASHKDHPLVERCHELCRNARSELLRLGRISEIDSEEHPLQEWIFALQCASAKFAGRSTPRSKMGIGHHLPSSPVPCLYG